MAGVLGLEPRPTVLETATLPTELYPYETIIIILKIWSLVNKYFIEINNNYVNYDIFIIGGLKCIEKWEEKIGNC